MSKLKKELSKKRVSATLLPSVCVYFIIRTHTYGYECATDVMQDRIYKNGSPTLEEDRMLLTNSAFIGITPTRFFIRGHGVVGLNLAVAVSE